MPSPLKCAAWCALSALFVCPQAPGVDREISLLLTEGTEIVTPYVVLNPDRTVPPASTGHFSFIDLSVPTDHLIRFNPPSVENRAPYALDDEVTAPTSAITVNPLGNDSDPDGDTIEIIGITQPQSGSARLIDSQTVEYTPENGGVRNASINYTIQDARGATAMGRVIFSAAQTIFAADPFEPDDTEGDAKLLDNPQSRTLHSSSDEDWVTFTITEAGTYALSAGGNGDTNLDLFQNGTLLASDDNSGLGDSGLISRHFEPGVYHVRVSHGGSEDSLSYTLGLLKTAGGGSNPGTDIYEPDNDAGSASPMNVGDQQNHAINPAGDIDWVRFELTATAEMLLETSGPSGDTVMALYESDGSTLIEDDDDGGSGRFSRIQRTLTAGVYYVSVRAFGSTATIASYQLSVRELNAPDAYEDDDSVATASSISLGDIQERSIHDIGDEDFVQFVLSQSAPVILETSGTSGDTVLYLYDQTGSSQIGYDDDGGTSAFSRIAMNLAAGTYYARVTEWGSDGTINNYTLRLIDGSDAHEGDEDPFVFAQEITSGETLSRSLKPVGDIDHLQFRLSDTSRVNIEVETQGAVRILVFAQDATIVAETSCQAGAGSCSIDVELPSGTYYCRVMEDGNDAEVASYDISYSAYVLASGCAPVLETRIIEHTDNKMVVEIDWLGVDSWGSYLMNLGLISVELDGIRLVGGSGIPTVKQYSVRQGWTPSTGAFSAGMLFDQSSSISFTDPQNVRVAAGLDFLDTFNDADEMALGQFPGGTNGMQLHGTFTIDEDSFEPDISGFANNDSGSTPLYDALVAMIGHTDTNASNANSAVVCFTDGDDTASTGTMDDVIDEATLAIVPCHMVGLSEGTDEAVISRIALSTGGSVMWTEHASALISYYRVTSDILRQENPRFTHVFELTGANFTGVTEVQATIHIDLGVGVVHELPLYFWPVVSN